MLKVGDRVFWNTNKDKERNLRDFQGVIFNSFGTNKGTVYEIHFDNSVNTNYNEFDDKGRRIIYKIDSINPNNNIIIKE